MQEEIIDSVLQKNDTLALLPTGGGKSICFQVPALAMDGICIVISPLIALMKDQVEQLRSRGILAYAIYSGMSKREIDVALDNCVYGGVKFLYVSPERIKTELFQERLKKMKVCLLAVDEAHCISQWGYDFRPSYLEIAELRTLLPGLPFIALTATATEQVKLDIQEKLKFKNGKVFQKSFARENLSYSVFEVEDKERKLLEVLHNVNGSSVVYLRSRNKTKDTAMFLKRQGIKAEFYHAGLPHAERAQKQEAWISGKTRVIVATNAFGMGIDKPDVRTVIHVDAPSTLEAYYQEAGRAGRDEQKAYAVLLYHSHDLEVMQQRVEEMYPPIDFIKKVYQSLANYYKIAVGSSLLASYDFDLEVFEQTYRLPKVETYYALRILEKEGLIQMNEAFHQPSRIYFLIGSNDLYEFQIANETYDLLIKTMLRMYGGEIFTHYCIINESSIASNMGKSISFVENALKKLEKMSVLEYQTRKDVPQLIFTAPRVDAARLSLDVKALERRKENDIAKVKAMVQYTKQELRCRTLVLLDYFGEISDKECGVCDICLKKKKEKTKGENYTMIRLVILSLIEKEELMMEQLMEQKGGFAKEEIVAVLRLMLDANEIRIDAAGKIVKVEN